MISSNYRKEIDGLRAFAVIAVIINHFNKNLLPSGYLGVDIFFVISGFVITSSLSNREDKKFWDFISSFYSRRIKRLVPALVFFVFISSVLICLVNPYPGLSLFTGLTSLFGVSNLYLLSESTDYFAESTQLNIFTHTWSLGVEEQFYFIFPLLIWFSGLSRKTKNGKRNFVFLISFFASISLAAFIYYSQTDISSAYFLMPCRFWEMASGSIFYFLSIRNKNHNNNLLEINPNLIFFLIIPVFFLPLDLNLISTLIVVLLTNIFILNVNKDFLIYKFLTQKFIVYIGLISYSLYLWHWGILSIASWTVGINNKSLPILIILVLITSIFSYNVIETPLRNSNWLNKKYFSFLFGSGLILVNSLALILFAKPLKPFFAKINKRINPASYEHYPAATDGLKCSMPKNVVNAFDECINLNKNSSEKGTIFLIGDSHASNHFYSIKNILPTNNFHELRTLLEWGLIYSLEGEKKCINTPCIQNSWEKYLSFFEKKLKSSDLVLFSWARDRIVKDRGADFVREKDQRKLDILQAKLIELRNVIHKRKSKLVLIDDIPKVCPDKLNFRQSIIVRGEIKNCELKKSISLDDREPLTKIYKNLSNKYDNVLYLDFHDALCSEDICNLFDSNNNLLYMDNSPHFSSGYPDPLKKEWELFFQKFNIK